MKKQRPNQNRALAPTLKDVAEGAGVSIAAVSAILNERPQAKRFSERTVSRVRASAAAVGYTPNRLARTLKGEQSGLIGVVTLNRQRSFYTLALQTADREAAAHGYELVQMDLRNDGKRLAALLRSLVSWRVEGVLLLTGSLHFGEDVNDALRQVNMPCVRVGLHNGEDSCHGITFDNYESGRLIASHLAALGHQHLAIIAGNMQNDQENARLAGIRDVMSESGISGDCLKVLYAEPAPPDLEAGHRLCEQIYSEFPEVTAISCLNDLLAVGALRYLQDANVPVPEKISISGFDDILLESFVEEHNRLGNYLYPRLTTVRGPLEESGQRGIRLILDSIEAGDPAPLKLVTLSPKLIIRESTAIASALRESRSTRIF